MHFFNPPRYLHLLEIIPTPDTSHETLAAARRFSDRMLGKGIVVAKDVPGFVANRLGVFGMVLAIRHDGEARPHDRRGRRAHRRAHRRARSRRRSARPISRASTSSAHVTKGLERDDRRGFHALAVGAASSIKAGQRRREERRRLLQARRQGDSHARLEDRRVQAAGEAGDAGARAARQAAACRAVRGDPRLERTAKARSSKNICCASRTTC